MIKNIIFDLGNVLLKFLPEEYLYGKIHEKSKVSELHEIIFKSSEWLELDKGTIEESEAVNNFCMRNPGHEECIRECMKGWYTLLEPIQESVDILKDIKEKGYKTYMLSNFHKLAFEHVSSNNDFFKLFDGGIISYREQLIKPHKEIYKKLAANYEIAPEESIFIDDTEINVSAAMECGFNVIRFENPGQLSEELKKYGVL